jgi:hypothetical protein
MPGSSDGIIAPHPALPGGEEPMRYPTLLILLVATLAALPAAAQSAEPVAEPRDVLDAFVRALAAHRWEEAVDHFSADHVSSQRDGMLAGRTGQFLVEALNLPGSCSGYAGSEKRAFACLDRIRAVRLLEPVPGRAEELPATVRFEVEPKRKAEPVVVELLLVPGRSHGGDALALEGAVG